MTYRKTDFINDINRLLKCEKIDNTVFTGYLEYIAGNAFDGIHRQGTW